MSDKVTCYGRTGGWCGIRHGDEAAAEKCQQQHHAACARAGGYSDRHTYDVADMATRADGSLYKMSQGDAA